MTDDLRDPNVNYTVPANQPAGMRIPEFVFRQLIGSAFKKIGDTIDTPSNIVDELFAMVPAEVRTQVKTWLRDHKNLFVDVSWPREAITMPMVVVEPQGEEEVSDEAFLGDQAGPEVFGRFDGVMSARAQQAIPEKHVTNIYIGAQDDRLALFLYQIIKFILLSNKDKLTKWYDIHNLVLSGQVLSFDEKQFPTFGYYRVLQATYMCLFDFNGSEEAAKIVSLDLLVDGVDGLGVTVTVPVPSP